MEVFSQIRLLIAAAISVLVFAMLMWSVFEMRAYRKRRALAKLAGMTQGKDTSEKIQKSRDIFFRRAFVNFANFALRIGERINVFRRLVDATRLSVRQAGIIDKNAVSYVIGAKLLGVPVAPAVTFLVCQPYDFFQDYPKLILAASAVFGFFMPNIWLINMSQKRQAEIQKHWADVLDVILISVTSGQSIEVAMRKAVLEMATEAPELSKELTITLTELSLMENRSAAYRRLAERVPFPFVKNFVFDVIQSETLGTPLGRALHQIAKENRLEKVQAVEKKAAALGPKLTIPMILFFFPILFVIIMAPAFL